MRTVRNLMLSVLMFGVLFVAAALAQNAHTTNTFSGAKVNRGTVTHVKENGKSILKLSPDFVPPDTPDPHWQVVDSSGKTYLLDRVKLKGDRIQTQITLPGSISDVVKVQIYCAWAEAVLGEASFPSPVM